MHNLLIIGKNLNIINSFKNKLSKRFCRTNFESVSHYLGMFLTQTGDFVSLNQKSYLEKVFLRFGIDIYKSASLTINPRVPNSMLPALEN